MFTQIRTSKENKEIVSKLTRKLNLGTENIIARIALTYSISKDRRFDLTKISNSSGKEYSKAVLFGDYINIYVGLICDHYKIHKSDKDIPKYIKMHIDDGLQIINQEIEDNPNIEAFDFLVNAIGY